MSNTQVADLTPDEKAERDRRVKRGAVLLGLVAAAFYIGFIVLTFFRGQH